MTSYEYLLSHDLFETLNYIKIDNDYFLITESSFSNCGDYIP